MMQADETMGLSATRDITDGRSRGDAANGRARDTMTDIRARYKRSRLRRFIRRRGDAAAYHLARLAIRLPQNVSLSHALGMAERAGDLAYAAMPGIRRLAFQHLAIAFGDTLSPAAREAIARESYRNAARAFVELVKLEDIRPRFDEYASIEGWEHVDEVLAAGRGGIVVTGHIGNWELFAAYAARRGVTMAAGARLINDPRLNRLLTDFRAGNGIRVIVRNSSRSGAEMLRVLKQRGILALLIDQDIRVPSVSVPFFGRLVRTPAVPAVLAVRRDIPVVIALARRRPEGGHHFTLTPPIYAPKTGDRLRDIVEMTRQFNQILEDRIRENPSEWNWWHRRWRRPPVPGLDLDAESQHAIAES